MDYQDIITIEPGKRSGKPCIRGMRITVYDILEYLASGMTEAEILADFSDRRESNTLGMLGYLRRETLRERGSTQPTDVYIIKSSFLSDNYTHQ
jgi:uncharacterized protein (DUF433 family)